MNANPRLIDRARAGLLVVDIQERLLPAMCERERVLREAARLVQGAVALRLPVFVTEQSRKGIGPTVPELASLVPGFAPREKLAFSALGDTGLLDELAGRQVDSVVLCGIEAHVCVCQTALELLATGHRVFVVADATSSRTPENWRAGRERMRDAGAVLVSTEMILFELLRRAGTEEFKAILKLVK